MNPAPLVPTDRRGHLAALTAALLVLLLRGSAVAQDRPRSTGGDASRPAAQGQQGGNDAGDAWAHVKFGATLEGYYEFNGNRPDDRVNVLRAYDTRSNSFSIQQAALVLDDAPDVEHGQRFGLRLDLQFGQATDTLQGNAANEPRPSVYRNVWQAYGSYVFPVGRGLQVDFGKFASILGYETNYAKDDLNFSRAYLFGFLPFYHAGLRATLPLSDRITAMYMLTNGIQETEDFNNFKSNQLATLVKPVKGVTWTTSYYFGQEQPDNGRPAGPDGWFRVFETNAAFEASPALTVAADVSHTTNQTHRGDPSLALDGLGTYARYRTTPATAFALRYERLDDQGLFASIAQVLQEATLTAEYKFADGFLLRGEIRRDWSSASIFPVHGGGASGHENTALVGLVWWIGNKQGAW